MQARQLPLYRGWYWLKEGLQLWRRNPALLTFASFGYLLALVLLTAVIPVIGQSVASLLMPVFSLGVLNTCRAIDEGRKGGPDLLFSGFRQNVRALLAIGGFYLLGSLAVITIATAIDDGTLVELLQSAGEQPTTLTPRMTFHLFIVALLSMPVTMAYWFAPLLSGWWNLPAPKAMFFSLVACLRNWRPFLAYAVALAVCFGLLPALIVGLIALVIPVLSGLITLLLPLFLIPVLFASFYVNARDIFAATVVDEIVPDSPEDDA